MFRDESDRRLKCERTVIAESEIARDVCGYFRDID